LYDPPEAKNGRISAAGDIWALGITMVEALTQCPPAWPDERSETASLPTSLPPAFVETVRRCLSRNPADRPTVTDLEAQIKRAPQAPVVSIPQPVVRKATGRATPPQKSPKQRLFVLAITVLFIILVAVWAGLRLFQSNPNSQQPASSTSQTSSQQAAPPATASRNPQSLNRHPRALFLVRRIDPHNRWRTLHPPCSMKKFPTFRAAQVTRFTAILMSRCV
jgi:serine/threonine protein kinase